MSSDNEKTVVKRFRAEGTHCDSCAKVIEKQARKVDGVITANFDFASETGTVEFDPEKTDMKKVLEAIEEKQYSCLELRDLDPKKAKHSGNAAGVMGWVFGIIGLLVAGYYLSVLFEGTGMGQLTANISYGLLFVVGLITGFHCVTMCGGFVVSYTADASKRGSSTAGAHAMYGAGKTISYTLIGAIFGLIGSIIAFTPMMRGIAGVLAGLFMMLFGLKMLNIIPGLRRVGFRTPGFLTRLVGKKNAQNSSPLMIGLLNGLMIACGPLQAIYIMAAGTGSAIEGGLMLLFFGLGTLPVMLGFGYVTSLISKKMTHKILKASGVIVIVLGVIMLNRGLALTGSGYDLNSIVASVDAYSGNGLGGVTGAAVGMKDSNVALLNGGYQEIRMDVTRYGWEPDKFVLQKGVPVRWIIDGKEINGCNNAIQVPKLGLEFKIKQGEQVIEFTPTEEGVIPWSCWMGMIPGTFIVTEDTTDTEAIQKQAASAPARTSGGSCGGSGGGGCGCGR